MMEMEPVSLLNVEKMEIFPEAWSLALHLHPPRQPRHQQQSLILTQLVRVRVFINTQH